jgi:PPOX class probable F420-dependent enzyme
VPVASRLEELGEAAYVSLATYRRDGREVRTPVWVAPADGHLYVFSEGTAGKVKRLRNSDRAALAPCDMRGGLKGDFTPASARIIDDAARIERAYAAFRAKYGWQIWLTNFFSRLSGRYDKRAILEIDLTG